MSKFGGKATSDGTTIHQWQFHGGGTQKWIFTHDGYGYYTIRQENVDQLLCMGVENNSTALNEDIVLSYEGFSLSDQAPLWQISATQSGAFKLTAKQSESLGYVLATSTSSQTNGARLIQNVYSNDTNYCDEWEITSFSMALFGIPDTSGNHDHSSALETIRSKGVWSSYRMFARNVSITELKDGLSTENFYISRSHGNYKADSNDETNIYRTGILLNDVTTANPNAVWLWSHYGSGIASGSSYIYDTEDYSNVSIALFVACYTGKGGETGKNLPARVVQLGAEVAIGFETSIDCADANTWTVSFWDAMLDGDTVASAANKACSATNGGISRSEVTICGNANYTLPIH